MVFDVCRLCLATDMRTIDIAGGPLQHVYEKLTSIPLCKMDWPVVACYVCHFQLTKTHDLMVKSLKADDLLTEIMLNASVINQETITTIDRKAYKLNDVRSRTDVVPFIIIDHKLLKEPELKDEPVTEERSFVQMDTRMLEVAQDARKINNEPIDLPLLKESEIKVEPITEDGDSVHVDNKMLEVTQDARKIKSETVKDLEDIKVEVDVKIETTDNVEDPEQSGGSRYVRTKEFEEVNIKEEISMDIEETELVPIQQYGDSDSEDLDDSTPPEILLEAQNVRDTLLPSKSKERYMAAYGNFMQWKHSKNVKSYSEDVLLAYFSEMTNRYKPTSLWCIYSMIKNTLRSKHDIDISPYTKLTSFLRRLAHGYSSLYKNKMLSPDNVEQFLKEAPDIHYLATKVALIFGITGACRRQELKNITLNDIENRGNTLLVKIINAKNKNSREFTIQGSFYEIVKKYIVQRPINVKTDRFFLKYQKGRCTTQPIGVNKFGSMPKEIAKFLELSDADAYTGHSFRRTSATMLADSTANRLC